MSFNILLVGRDKVVLGIVTDLISAVVRLLKKDINGLVVEAWEALEPVKL